MGQWHSMERIAFFLPDMDAGGAQRAVMRLAAYLVAERGVEVDLVVNRADGALAAERDEAVHLYELGSGRIRYAVPRLLRYLRVRRPDALVCTLLGCIWAGVIAGRLSRSGARVLVRQANSFGDDFRAESEQRSWSGQIGARALPWLFRLVDGVVAVSDDVRRQVISTGVPASRVHSIANPISTSELADRAAAPCGHPWLDGASTEPVVVAAGRLCRQKGFDVLIDAVAWANRERALHCIILGDGPLRAALQQRANAAGVADRIDLVGVATNPFACFRQANAVVLSSRWEGMPNVLLEAIALGCPVVAADCPGGSRQVLESVGAGGMVPVEDVESLGRAILGAVAEPSAYAADPNAVAAIYGFAAVADRYLSVLRGETIESAVPTRPSC